MTNDQIEVHTQILAKRIIQREAQNPNIPRNAKIHGIYAIRAFVAKKKYSLRSNKIRRNQLPEIKSAQLLRQFG
ncbi:MAG: hypothetical protein EOO51_13270 [Flavobacterium sp.]|nr:MAG: hypothetical protein EOO51_13270 [Flavobacterium sp.]